MPEDDKFDGAMLDGKLDGFIDSLNVEAATMLELIDRIESLERELKTATDMLSQGTAGQQCVADVFRANDTLKQDRDRLQNRVAELQTDNDRLEKEKS